MPTRRWKQVSARPAPLHLINRTETGLEDSASNLWDVGSKRSLEIGLNASA